MMGQTGEGSWALLITQIVLCSSIQLKSTGRGKDPGHPYKLLPLLVTGKRFVVLEMAKQVKKLEYYFRSRMLPSVSADSSSQPNRSGPCDTRQTRTTKREA